MKPSIAALISFACFYWKVCGSLVELLVEPGDNVTLHCDCQIVKGQEIHWIKICSSQIQPQLAISAYKSLLEPIPRFSLAWNVTSNSYDLVIENITDADLGLYYCTRVEEKRIAVNGIMTETSVYHNGDLLTKLTFQPLVLPSERPPERALCDCVRLERLRLLLLSVCPVSALLSATLAFFCGYRCCRKTGLKSSEDPQGSSETQRHLSQKQNIDTEIYYASLNIPKKGNKQPQAKKQKIKREQSSDFSVYNSVRLHI